MQKQEEKRSKDHEDEKHKQKQERDIADFAKSYEEKDISAYLISDDGHFEGPVSRWKKILTRKLPPTVLSKVAGMFDDCTVAFSDLKIRLLDLE